MEALPSTVLGCLPLTLILLLVYWTTRCQTQDSSNRPNTKDHGAAVLPPVISATVPILGHLLSYVKDGPSYFNKLWYEVNRCWSIRVIDEYCSNSVALPVFAIRIATVKVSLTQPELARFLPKVKHLSLNPLVLDMMRQSLGLGQFSSALLQERDPVSRQFGPHASRVFRDEFIPNVRLRNYVESLDESMRVEMYVSRHTM